MNAKETHIEAHLGTVVVIEPSQEAGGRAASLAATNAETASMYAVKASTSKPRE